MGDTGSDWIALISEDAQLRLWQMRGDKLVARGDAPDTAPDLPVIGCGFAEAAPRTLPCAPLPDALPLSMQTGPQIHLFPPLQNPKPAHLSAGAELAIAGFVAHDPEFDGVLCIPGTTTIWAHISAREVVSLQSFVTAELVQALGGGSPQLDSDILSEIMARPERLASSIASARASGQTDHIASALIGAELAAAKPYWLGQQVAVFTGHQLSPLYLDAINAQGAAPRSVEGEAMRISGLIEAHKRL